MADDTKRTTSDSPSEDVFGGVSGALTSHLRVILPHLLGVGEAEVASALDVSHAELTKFSAAPAGSVLVAGGDPASSAILIRCGEPRQDAAPSVQVACIKRSAGSLRHTEPLASQLHVMALAPGSALDTVHACLRGSLAPLLRSAALPQQMGLEHKLSDLQLSLMRGLSEFEKREVELPVPPAVERAMRVGGKPSDVVSELERTGELMSTVGQLHQSLPAAMDDLQGLFKLTTQRAAEAAHSSVESMLSFWARYEASITHTVGQLTSPPAVACVAVLRSAPRCKELVERLGRAQEALELRLRQAQNLNKELLRELPISALLSSLGSTSGLETATEQLLIVFRRLANKDALLLARSRLTLDATSPLFPLSEVSALLVALSRDLAEQLHRCLADSLLRAPYPSAQRAAKAADSVFEVWESGRLEFHAAARAVMMNEGHTRHWCTPGTPPPMPAVAHAPLAKRVRELAEFRKVHERLAAAINDVLMASGGTNDSADWGATTSGEGGVSAVAVVDRGAGAGEGGVATGSSAEGRAALSAAAARYELGRALEVAAASRPVESSLEEWGVALEAYEARTERVVRQIATVLRRRLSHCRSATEMFRVCGRFSALNFRPELRAVVTEIEPRLMSEVRDDVETLQARFKQRSRDGGARLVSRLRGIPEVAFNVQWCRQLERRLELRISQLRSVLGDGHSVKPEATRLLQTAEQFRAKLDTRPLFEEWQAVARARVDRFNPMAPVLVVRALSERTNYEERGAHAAGGSGSSVCGCGGADATGGTLELSVSFESTLATVWKEAQSLQSFGFRVSSAVLSACRQAQLVFPHAAVIVDLIRAHTHVTSKLDARSGPLMAGSREAVHAVLTKTACLHPPLRWADESMGFAAVPSRALQGFVAELDSAVHSYVEREEELRTLLVRADAALCGLGTCEYSIEGFEKQLAELQAVVDQLDLGGYTDLTAFVDELQRRVDAALVSRLDAAVALWTRSFEEPNRDQARFSQHSADGEMPRSPGSPHIPHQSHTLILHGAQFLVQPPIERARLAWCSALREWIAVITSQRPLRCGSYDDQLRSDTADGQLGGVGINGVGAAGGVGAEALSTSLKRLLHQLPGGRQWSAYEIIERVVRDTREHVKAHWKRHGALWQIELLAEIDRLDEDMEAWQQRLLELRRARAALYEPNDTSSGSAVGIGWERPRLTLDAQQLQAHLGHKYDNLISDLLEAFGALLARRVRALLQGVHEARLALERTAAAANLSGLGGGGLDSGELAALVDLVSSLRRLETEHAPWAERLEELEWAERFFERQRSLLPPGWMSVEQVGEECAALKKLLEDTRSLLTEKTPVLRSRLAKTVTALGRTEAALREDWRSVKPDDGALRAEDTVEQLQQMDQKVEGLVADRVALDSAREALGLPREVVDAGDGSLCSMREEIGALTEVWKHLLAASEQLHVLRETLLLSVVPTKAPACLPLHACPQTTWAHMHRAAGAPAPCHVSRRTHGHEGHRRLPNCPCKLGRCVKPLKASHSSCERCLRACGNTPLTTTISRSCTD